MTNCRIDLLVFIFLVKMVENNISEKTKSKQIEIQIDTHITHLHTGFEATFILTSNTIFVFINLGCGFPE